MKSMKVIAREVIIRSSLDDTDFYTVDTLKKGDKINVTDKKLYFSDGVIDHTYYKCVLPNGDEGYIRSEAVK